MKAGFRHVVTHSVCGLCPPWRPRLVERRFQSTELPHAACGSCRQPPGGPLHPASGCPALFESAGRPVEVSLSWESVGLAVTVRRLAVLGALCWSVPFGLGEVSHTKNQATRRRQGWPVPGKERSLPAPSLPSLCLGFALGGRPRGPPSESGPRAGDWPTPASLLLCPPRVPWKA